MRRGASPSCCRLAWHGRPAHGPAALRAAHGRDAHATSDVGANSEMHPMSRVASREQRVVSMKFYPSHRFHSGGFLEMAPRRSRLAARYSRLGENGNPVAVGAALCRDSRSERPFRGMKLLLQLSFMRPSFIFTQSLLVGPNISHLPIKKKNPLLFGAGAPSPRTPSETGRGRPVPIKYSG
jgi:hypothetical protein